MWDFRVWLLTSPHPLIILQWIFLGPCFQQLLLVSGCSTWDSFRPYFHGLWAPSTPRELVGSSALLGKERSGPNWTPRNWGIQSQKIMVSISGIWEHPSRGLPGWIQWLRSFILEVSPRLLHSSSTILIHPSYSNPFYIPEHVLNNP